MRVRGKGGAIDIQGFLFNVFKPKLPRHLNHKQTFSSNQAQSLKQNQGCAWAGLGFFFNPN